MILFRLVFGCYFPLTVKYGPGLKLGYWGLGIVIHDRVVIGANCTISHNVTIGGTTKLYGVPVLGDNIYVGAGASILGPVKIGSGSVIGANAVIIKDIPENSLVVGVPGKVVKKNIRLEDYV